MLVNAPVRIGFLWVSSSIPDETDEHLAQSTLMTFLTERLSQGWEATTQTVRVPSRAAVERHLCDFVDEEGCLLVFTLGNIGPAAADVVPDAIQTVCPKRFPGFGERIRSDARTIDSTGILLRPTAGIRQQSLIVSLPDGPTALRACLPALFPAIPNAVFLASGHRIDSRAET